MEAVKAYTPTYSRLDPFWNIFSNFEECRKIRISTTKRIENVPSKITVPKATLSVGQLLMSKYFVPNLIFFFRQNVKHMLTDMVLETIIVRSANCYNNKITAALQ